MSDGLQPSEPDVVLPPSEPVIRRGERADAIRKLRDRNPAMPQAVIARKVGCTEANVSQVLKSYLKGVTLDELEAFRSDKPAVFESLQHRTLSSITDEDLANATYLQKITGAAILQDKLQLMNGLPTSIHVTVLMDIVDALRKRERDR